VPGNFSGFRLPLSWGDGFVFVSLHPGDEIFFDDFDVPDAVGRMRVEQSMVTSAPAMSIFRTSDARWMPLVAARLPRGVRKGWQSSAVERAWPWACSTGCWVSLPAFRGQCPAGKTGEQHQPVRGRRRSSAWPGWQSGEERAEFHRHRDFDLGLHRLENVLIGVFDLTAGRVRLVGM